jgi:hypothetical protein
MITETRQIMADRVKRAMVDVGQRVGRLQTPMTQLMGALRSNDMLPERLVALELFGMHGLWHTRDYVRHCASLELYEINPTYAAYAARTLPNTEVVVSDSIAAVKADTLRKLKYNFIVADNPIRAPFGDGYAEHFDLFPEVLDKVDSGVLIVNFIGPRADFADEQARRRRAFYGTVRPSVEEAVDVYRARARDAGLEIPRYTYTFRHMDIGYLAFRCERA